MLIVGVVIVGGYYYEINRPSTARASIPLVPVVKEDRWNACRSYAIVFEMRADFGDSFSMRIAEVKASSKTRVPWEVFELEIVSMNITLGAEIRERSTRVTLIVHPKKGIVTIGVCETFDLKIDVRIDVEFIRLGERRTQSLTIQSPPISIEVCG